MRRWVSWHDLQVMKSVSRRGLLPWEMKDWLVKQVAGQWENSLAGVVVLRERAPVKQQEEGAASSATAASAAASAAAAAVAGPSSSANGGAGTVVAGVAAAAPEPDYHMEPSGLFVCSTQVRAWTVWGGEHSLGG